MADKVMLWECFLGDCLMLMADIPDGSVDMILCDLPYGTTACKWDVVIPFEQLWRHYKRVIKPSGAIVLFGQEPFSSVMRMSNIKDYKYDWIWEKEKGTGFAFSNKQPLRKTENISVFYKSQPFYDSQGELLDKPYTHTLPKNKSDTMNHMPSTNSDGDRIYVTYTHSKKTNLLKFARENANKGIHPTQKPAALCEYLIETYTHENEIVLDNCMGSGTTGVACMNTGRRFIGIEQDIKYFDLACERINKVDAIKIMDSQQRCEYCDDTGDVTALDGEYRGPCNCGAPSQFKEEMARIDAELKVGAGDTAVQGDMLLTANVELRGGPAVSSPERPA